MTTERVTFRPPGAKRARSIYLDQAAVGRIPILGEVLVGIEVDRFGDEVSGKGFDQRQHVIALEAIAKRTPVIMDNLYGEYVESHELMSEESQ